MAKFEAKFYVIGEDGKKYECIPASLNTIDPSEIRSGAGKSFIFSKERLMGKESAIMINKHICEEQGHDWNHYEVSTGYWGNDIEQAGICERCGFDTHAHLEES